MPKLKRSEHQEQLTLFQWADLVSNQHPELNLMFAIPNGGLRHVQVAKKLKAEGVKSGVPDICLPVARKNYHGLFIEMKVGYNKPSNNQKWWIANLKAESYLVEVCYSADEAINIIKNYLKP